MSAERLTGSLRSTDLQASPPAGAGGSLEAAPQVADSALYLLVLDTHRDRAFCTDLLLAHSGTLAVLAATLTGGTGTSAVQAALLLAQVLGSDVSDMQEQLQDSTTRLHQELQACSASLFTPQVFSTLLGIVTQPTEWDSTAEHSSSFEFLHKVCGIRISIQHVAISTVLALGRQGAQAGCLGAEELASVLQDTDFWDCALQCSKYAVPGGRTVLAEWVQFMRAVAQLEGEGGAMAVHACLAAFQRVQGLLRGHMLPNDGALGS
jgi:hypothetical protein